MMTNKYLNKSSFAKLLLFNWVQTRNSILFWILLSLNFISLPLISSLLYSLTDNFLHYSIFVILVPLISSFIQIMFLVYWLYLENKHNSIDYKLFCSQYSRFHIALSRIIFIIFTLVPIIVINDLFSIFFIFINSVQFFGAMIIANTFINVFIYIIIICLLVLFSDRMGRVAYIFLGLFLVVVTLGGSLISRPFIVNMKNDYLNYHEPLSQYNNSLETSKLVSSDSQDILASKNITNSKLTQSDIVYNANKKIVFYNNFIPSEWTLTLYSSLFSLFNFEINYSHHSYDLLAANVNNNVNGDLSDLANFYAIRPVDLDFTKLFNDDYEKLILENIDKIIAKYSLVTNPNTLSEFSNAFVINESNKRIEKWNSLSSNVINFLRDATGVNTEFSQLFYITKYNSLFENKLSNLFSIINTKYNEQISTLFKNVFTSPITMLNLFQVAKFDITNLVLNTGNFIQDYYPMIETNSTNVLEQKVISINDKNFLKEQLIIFDNNNNPFFLSNELRYEELTKTQLNSFRESIGLPTISDNTTSNTNDFNKEIWYQIVDDTISLSYNTANYFLKQWKSIYSNLFDYTLMGTTIDLSQFNAILNPVNGNQNGYGEIFIIAYIVLFVLLVWLTIRKYQKYYKQQ